MEIEWPVVIVLVVEGYFPFFGLLVVSLRLGYHKARVGRYYDILSKSCQYPLIIQLLHVINLTDIIV